MKAITLKSLQNLVGKVCTILTTTVSKTNFQDTQFSDFFTGIIESIDEDGIWAKHHMTGCRTFYFLPYVVSIMEEQVVTQDDPQYEQLLAEIKKAPPEQQVNVVPVDPLRNNEPVYFDPDTMASLAKQAQEVHGKMLRKNQ